MVTGFKKKSSMLKCHLCDKTLIMKHGKYHNTKNKHYEEEIILFKKKRGRRAYLLDEDDDEEMRDYK